MRHALPAPVLRAQGLGKRFGAVVVVDDVDLTVAQGVCLGVIGPNGAGKTSLFNLLDGSLRPDAGRIELAGEDITHLPRHERARRGIGRAFQVPQPFPHLTVFENVLTAACFGAGMDQREGAHRAVSVLAGVGLAGKADRRAGTLTLLDRKRLELAKAMAVNAKLLLLDEIAGGLTDAEVPQLVEVILQLKERHAIVWIEHVAHALLAVADRILVLHFGRKLIEDEAQAAMQSRAVREIYLGLMDDAVEEEALRAPA